MLTRRELHLFAVSLGAVLLPARANSQQSDAVMVRIRADETVRRHTADHALGMK
jgi:hypothetical protein